MRQNVSIYEIEEKTSGKGTQYWSVKTNKGNMSIFDAELAFSVMQQGLGKICDLEVTEKGNYKNIVAINGAYGTAEEKPKEKEGFSRNQESKDASMMVSYAKDIVIAALSRIPPTEKLAENEIDKMLEATARSISKAYKIIREAIII